MLKSIRNRMLLVESEIKSLETSHQSTNDHNILVQIRPLVTEFNKLAESEIKHLGKYAVARIYAEDDRSSATLANAIRPPKGDNTIFNVQNPSGDIVNTSSEILDAFADYYQNLYTTKAEEIDESDEEYFNYIKVYWLSNSDRERLIGPLRPSAITAALKEMPAGN